LPCSFWSGGVAVVMVRIGDGGAITPFDCSRDSSTGGL
jgi:hypothetical protein